jgi:diguanylate cyclase (GGDEF)-like protein
MHAKLTAKYMDTIMIANAAVMGIVCLVVAVVLLQVFGEPFRQSRDIAVSLIAGTSDISVGDDMSALGIDPDGVAGIRHRLDTARAQLKQVREGAFVDLYSDHALLEPVSTNPDSVRISALAEMKAGNALISRTETIDGVSYVRLFAPLLAPSDCLTCRSAGLPPFVRGDVIGVREIRYPLASIYSRAVPWLLLALVMLAAALGVFMGIIIPFIKRNRQEKAQIHKLASTLEEQATTDPLTGLHNRRFFEHALQEYLVEFNRTRSPLGLLVFDLDHFKKINDAHGHDAGDMVLREVALRLRAITRDNDVVARIGGEEFAVITPFANREQLLAVAERYRSSISQLNVNIGKIALKPTISIGVATNEGDVRLAVDLFKSADEKLYQAKRDGRNRVAA